MKALEEYGIGRPSTYASIIQTLLFRKYVQLESRRFRPTDVGRAVSKFLTSHFTRYVDYDFTAKLEDELDAVSRGEEDWMPLMEKFWKPFKATVDEKTERVDRSEGHRRARARHRSGIRQAGSRAPGPLRAVSRRSAARTTTTSRNSPRCARARACTRSAAGRGAEAVQAAARTLGELEDKDRSASASAASARSPSTAIPIASLKKEDDPYTIELDRAVELIHGRRGSDRANRIIKTFEGTDIQVLNGRFGPYITDGELNGKIPKDREPASLTQDECEALLAEGKPVRKFGRAKKVVKKAAVKKAPAAKKVVAKKAPAKKAAKKATKKKVD